MRDRQRLRIVFYEPSGRGGICHYTWELAEHLARAGSEVTVLTTSRSELAHFPRSFRIRALFRRSWVRQVIDVVATMSRRRSKPPTSGEGMDRPAGATTRSSLRRLRIRMLHWRVLAGFLLRRPDVVHFQWLADRACDLSFIRDLKALRIPVVYTAHEVMLNDPPSVDDLAFLSRFYRAVDQIIVHAAGNRAKLAGAFGIAEERITVIPHGPYRFTFGLNRPPVSKKEARRRLGIPSEKRVVLFFGLIKRYKGLEVLVSAFGAIEQEVSDAFLLIVGDVYRGEPEAYRYYSSLLEGLQGRRNVRTVIEYVPVADIPTYFAASDLVALPYTQTTQSGVLLAAYGAGRPVVVSETGGLPEVVEEGKTGLVVPPLDNEALARAIIGILSEPQRARRMGEEARKMSSSAFGWPRVARRTAETYILARQRRAGRRHTFPRSAQAPGVLPERRGSAARRA
jgi:glycosyltransferase involved in cell wall biosynthesis